MGDVVPFPIKTPSCDDCDHASFSTHGLFCLFFREEIWRTSIAEECDEFLPLPSPVRKVAP
jgi:hypothetical protein